MKQKFISLGMSLVLSSSLYAFDYNLVNGEQMLGAVNDITDFTPFNNKCVNYIYFVDFQNNNTLVHNVNQTLSGYSPLQKINKGQGFILNATGSCTVTPAEPAEEIVYKGFNYKTVTSPTTNKVWLDRNLGASKACDQNRNMFASDLAYETSQKDCFGDYYQWGRNPDGHQAVVSQTTTILENRLITIDSLFVLTDSSTTYYDWLNPSYDLDGQKRSANLSKTDGTFICPVGFRVPTMSELASEKANMSNFINILKFPLNGWKARHIANKVYDKGSIGSIWSSTPDNTYQKYGTSLIYDEFTGNQRNGDERAIGRGIRCIKN